MRYFISYILIFLFLALALLIVLPAPSSAAAPGKALSCPKQPGKTMESKDNNIRHPIAKGFGRLIVHVDPPDAQIKLITTKTRFSQGIKLPKGPCIVVISQDRYVSQEVTIRIIEGKVNVLKVLLAKQAEQTISTAPSLETTPSTPIPPPPKPSTSLSTSTLGVQIHPNTKSQTQPQDLAKCRLTQVQPSDSQIRSNIQPQFKQDVESDSYNCDPKINQKDTSIRQKIMTEIKQPSTESQDHSTSAALVKEKSVTSTYETAFQAANKAVAQRPRDAGAWLQRGLVFQDHKQDCKAVDDLSRAIDLQPDNPTLYLKRAISFIALDDKESACFDLWNACALGQCHEIDVAKKTSTCP
ncbi:exported hypothetical protein [Desulfovibrionales bacterium]